MELSWAPLRMSPAEALPLIPVRPGSATPHDGGALLVRPSRWRDGMHGVVRLVGPVADPAVMEAHLVLGGELYDVGWCAPPLPGWSWCDVDT